MNPRAQLTLWLRGDYYKEHVVITGYDPEFMRKLASKDAETYKREVCLIETYNLIARG